MSDTATEHAESWSPEDEPPTREEARAYERFVRVLLKEEGGQIPDALARKYINTLLDPAFAKAHPRTHARMLENYHRMVQADHHLAQKLPLPEGEEEQPAQTWQIHIHRPGERPGGAADGASEDTPGDDTPEAE